MSYSASASLSENPTRQTPGSDTRKEVTIVDVLKQMIDLAYGACRNAEKLHFWEEAEIWGATFYKLCDVVETCYGIKLIEQYADM